MNMRTILGFATAMLMGWGAATVEASHLNRGKLIHHSAVMRGKAFELSALLAPCGAPGQELAYRNAIFVRNHADTLFRHVTERCSVARMEVELCAIERDAVRLHHLLRQLAGLTTDHRIKLACRVLDDIKAHAQDFRTCLIPRRTFVQPPVYAAPVVRSTLHTGVWGRGLNETGLFGRNSGLHVQPHVRPHVRPHVQPHLQPHVQPHLQLQRNRHHGAYGHGRHRNSRTLQIQAGRLAFNFGL